MAWMTGKGSSVGPGIIRISREAWGADHLIGSVLVEGMIGLLSPDALRRPPRRGGAACAG